MYLEYKKITYVIIEYVSGKIEVYPIETKEQSKAIIARLAADLQHIEDIKIIDMTEEV